MHLPLPEDRGRLHLSRSRRAGLRPSLAVPFATPLCEPRPLVQRALSCALPGGSSPRRSSGCSASRRTRGCCRGSPGPRRGRPLPYPCGGPPPPVHHWLVETAARGLPCLGCGPAPLQGGGKRHFDDEGNWIVIPKDLKGLPQLLRRPLSHLWDETPDYVVRNGAKRWEPTISEFRQPKAEGSMGDVAGK